MRSARKEQSDVLGETLVSLANLEFDSNEESWGERFHSVMSGLGKMFMLSVKDAHILEKAVVQAVRERWEISNRREATVMQRLQVLGRRFKNLSKKYHELWAKYMALGADKDELQEEVKKTKQELADMSNERDKAVEMIVILTAEIERSAKRILKSKSQERKLLSQKGEK